MELSEDQIIEKHGKNCRHCNRNTLLPYEYEWTCISCNYNVIRQKRELSKIQRKKTNFVNRLKYAELRILCIYVDVYQLYERNDYNKRHEVVLTKKI